METAINNFSKLDKPDTLETGLGNFEALLAKHKVPEEKWATHLEKILRGCPAELLEALHLPINIEYEEVRSCYKNVG